MAGESKGNPCRWGNVPEARPYSWNVRGIRDGGGNVPKARPYKRDSEKSGDSDHHSGQGLCGP